MTIITQTAAQPNTKTPTPRRSGQEPSPLLGGTEGGLKCRYCDSPAVDGVTPPLCERHLDVIVLICTLQERDLPVSLDYAQHLMAGATRNGGHWTLTPDELPEYFAATLRRVRRRQRGQNDLSPEVDAI